MENFIFSNSWNVLARTQAIDYQMRRMRIEEDEGVWQGRRGRVTRKTRACDNEDKSTWRGRGTRTMSTRNKDDAEREKEYAERGRPIRAESVFVFWETEKPWKAGFAILVEFRREWARENEQERREREREREKNGWESVLPVEKGLTGGEPSHRWGTFPPVGRVRLTGEKEHHRWGRVPPVGSFPTGGEG